MPDDSEAARFNQRVLRKLERALVRQPDVDLSRVLPASYPSTLALKKQGVQAPVPLKPVAEVERGTSSPPADESDDQASSQPPRPLSPIDESLPASVLYPLSTTVECLLGKEEPRWSESSHFLLIALSRVLRSATVLFHSTTGRFVARCGEHIVAKAIDDEDSTEYTTLKFLESKAPDFPAPKPHGVLVVGKVWYMFMSYIPDVSLDKIWRNLNEYQKNSLKSELNTMLLKLREIPFEPGNMLGGVAGQPCKDTRRQTRMAPSPIYTSEGLWEFMFGCARNKDTVYGKILHNFSFPPREQRIIFIHGDFRPANIMVRCCEDDRIEVTGLIDWEMGGFYPEDLECVKALNNLSPIGHDDWYLFLPDCNSPRNHLESVYADYVWDRFVVV